MAHIQKRKLKDGTIKYRAIVHRKGHKTLSKVFQFKKDAERWGGEQDRSIDLKGMPLIAKDLEKIIVGDIVRRYLDEVTIHKKNVSEESVLKRLLKHPICKHSFATIERKHAQDWKNERLKATWIPHRSKGPPKRVTARTVARDINSIRNVFSVASDEWGLTPIHGNPFSRPKIKGSKYRRKRRLLPGELPAIMAAIDQCRGLNKIYVPLAIYLAIETAMREQEIFNLVWGDIDFEKRTIEIRKSKTDHEQETSGRTIVLSYWAEHHLRSLKQHFQSNNTRLKLVYADDAPVFVISQDAFSQSWDDVLNRANIKPDARGERLIFRDLRREAGSRFDEAELTRRQNEMMMGQNPGDTNSIYVVSELKRIQEKLDRYALQMLLTDFENARSFGSKFSIGLHIEGLTQSRMPAETKYRTVTAFAWKDEQGFVERTMEETLLYSQEQALLAQQKANQDFEQFKREKLRAIEFDGENFIRLPVSETR